MPGPEPAAAPGSLRGGQDWLDPVDGRRGRVRFGAAGSGSGKVASHLFSALRFLRQPLRNAPRYNRVPLNQGGASFKDRLARCPRRSASLESVITLRRNQ